MKSKVKSHRGRREKGAEGEREAAKEIMRRCQGIHAERNARNGKPTSDVVVWRTGCENAKQHIIEIKRVESLDIGTRAMERIRGQATKDGAIGILWRRNRKPWRLEVCSRDLGWVTVSGEAVWDVIWEIVQ